ncbi:MULTISPECIES: hypothetical protein [Streptomyces rochei group]|uniref:hypothetical protein n=1 Tax=Streptomyces rochei group TaxID=2867164 RepID=UPI0018759162|nr:hypothetical protein [Streptomyces vinaceusdrappus]GHC37258.1 hypothetical protein GCM10010308_64790 [Streptomyces vinaceusdrappus]
MPITHSDRISGTIYAIATNAEAAGNLALDYLRDKTDGKTDSYGVFDHQKDADSELHNKFSSYDPARDRVYAIRLDIRIADEK